CALAERGADLPGGAGQGGLLATLAQHIAAEHGSLVGEVLRANVGRAAADGTSLCRLRYASSLMRP
ncbi:hypothetical protein ACTFBX_21025, partial [Aeromonas caviae]